MLTQKTTSTKKQVFIFFACTYGLSWSLFAFGQATGIEPIMMLGIWGPSITSLLLTYKFYGKKGVKAFFARFKRVNIAWYWWVLLILLPATIHFTGRSIWQYFFDGEINPFFLKPQYWLQPILGSFIIAGIGEEFGWRGFALPRLQKHFSPLVAILILGLFHSFWHLPTYWLGQGIHNVPAWFVLAFALPWTVIFNWLYNKSGGSMIFAVAFHAISNASLSIVRFMPLESEVPISPELIRMTGLPIDLGGRYLAVVAMYWLVAIIIILAGGFKKVNTDIP
jgi:CAAX protease family protein